MIHLCELSFLGRAHVPFNAGLLATIQAAFPKENLCFYGSSTHIEELKTEVSQSLASSIAWKEIFPPASDASYFKRFPRELKILRRLLRSLAESSESRLVLTSAYPSTVLALKVARGFIFRSLPVQIVVHGMSGVVGKRYRHPIHRFQEMKTAMTLLGNSAIHYIVLEQAIRDTVVTHFPLLSGKVDALEHPLSPHQTEFPTIDLSEPIRFGFLGLADKPKGFPVFVALANRISAKYGKRVEFHAVGHLSQSGVWPAGIDALVTKPQDTLMSRTAFLNNVALLHFIVLPHEAGSYALTASGVLLDAIGWAKPVICRKIPIFESMFRRHGDIGYLFDSDEELNRVVEGIVESADNSRYQRQVSSLRSARKTRHPEALAEQYRYIYLRSCNQ